MLSPEGIHNKTILFAVLNWGLGHASRSIPLIQQLIDQDNRLVLASDGVAAHLLRKEFPDIEILDLPPYNVRYGKKLWQIVIFNMFRVALAILKEHLYLRAYLKSSTPDIVISDSRFGFYSAKVHCCIISHQLHIPAGALFWKKFINLFNHFFLARFSEIWIPDFEDRRLSGEMSLPFNRTRLRYLGALSRMQVADIKNEFGLAIILSGPEPSRSRLEFCLAQKFVGHDLKIALVRGSTSDTAIEYPPNWKVTDLALSQEVNNILLSSKLVISRAGYSSVLDYYKLGIPAILIPTPGQSEQEYLGEYLDGRYGFRTRTEKQLDQIGFPDEVLQLINLPTT